MLCLYRSCLHKPASATPRESPALMRHNGPRSARYFGLGRAYKATAALWDLASPHDTGPGARTPAVYTPKGMCMLFPKLDSFTTTFSH